MVDRSSDKVNQACIYLFVKSWLHTDIQLLTCGFNNCWRCVLAVYFNRDMQPAAVQNQCWISPGRNMILTHSVSAWLLVSTATWTLTEKNPLDRNVHQPKFNAQVPIGCLWEAQLFKHSAPAASSYPHTGKAVPDTGQMYFQNNSTS